MTGEGVAIHRQGAARRHLAGVRGSHDQGAAATHLGVQKANGVVLPIVRPERVGTDQLGQSLGLVRRRHSHRPHFVQHHREPGLCGLPSGLGPRESAADHMDGVHG